MKTAETAKGDGPVGRVVDNHRMNKPRARFVHVFEPFQRAVPLADENAFIAFVAVCGDHRYKDVTGGNVLFYDGPPRVAGLEARLIKPHIQPRAAQAGLEPLDRVVILASIANKNRWRFRGSSGA